MLNLQHHSTRHNPSIERTRTGRALQALISFWALRALPARAAHVKRWASQTPTMNEQDSLHAAIYESVKLHDHDPSWPVAFLAERGRLISLFADQFVELEHIGSTAIPGLKAKPIIDILAGVKSMAVAEALTEPLCRSGYTTSVELNETLGDRKWFMRWANGHRTHHLHVVVHDAEPWSERMRFRDARVPGHGVARLDALAPKSLVWRETYSPVRN